MLSSGFPDSCDPPYSHQPWLVLTCWAASWLVGSNYVHAGVQRGHYKHTNVTTLLTHTGQSRFSTAAAADLQQSGVPVFNKCLISTSQPLVSPCSPCDCCHSWRGDSHLVSITPGSEVIFSLNYFHVLQKHVHPLCAATWRVFALVWDVLM